MDKEQLKLLYYYIGPFIYKNQMVRVFRTKTNYNLVFYYDKNGDLTPVGAKDALELTHFFTPDKNIISDIHVEISQAKQKPNTLIPPTKPNVLQKQEVSESYKSKQYQPTTKFELTLIDDQNPDFSQTITIEATHIPEKDQPFRKVTVSDIESIQENIYTLYSYGIKGKLLQTIFNRLNDKKIVFNDVESGKESSKFSASGYYSRDYKQIQILKTYRESSFNQDKSTIKHEAMHTMSDGIISGVRTENGAFCVFNEIFTEVLSNKNDKKYYSYSEYVFPFINVFGDVPPIDAIEAYFENDPEKMCTSLAREAGVSVEDIKNYALIMDAHLQLLRQYDSIPSKIANNLLATYEESYNNYVAMFSLYKAKADGKKLTTETIEQLARNSNLTSGDIIKNITKALFASSPESSTNKEKKLELLFELYALNPNYIAYFYESINSDRQYNSEDIENLQTIDSQIRNNSNLQINKIDDELATLFINSLSLDYQIKNLETAETLYNKNSMAVLRQLFLNSPFVENENTLDNFYQNSNSLYKDLIVDCFTGATQFNNNSRKIVQSLYDRLNEEEQIEVLTTACKKAIETSKNSPTKLDVIDTNSITSITSRDTDDPMMVKNVPLPNKEIADMLFNVVTKCNQIIDYYTISDICYGYEQDEQKIFETASKNMLGEEKYNEMKETLDGYIQDGGYEYAFAMVNNENEIQNQIYQEQQSSTTQQEQSKTI